MKFNADQLAELSEAERCTRMQDALLRVETRRARVFDRGTDLTARETELTEADMGELEALREATAIAEHNERAEHEAAQRLRLVSDALDTARRGGVWVPTLLVSEVNLRSHVAALREGRFYGAVEPVETRSQVGAASDMGSAAAWNSGAPNQPNNLIVFSGVPVSPLTGRTAQVPQYTPPTGASGADEGSNHGEFDAVTKVDLTAMRYGRWTDVSSIVAELDDLRSINVMHGWGIAHDLDLVAVTAIEAAASTPADAGADLEGAVRQAVLEVAANTYTDVGQLVIVGTPLDVSLLTGTTPTSGADVESFAVRFSGARLYASNEASDGQVTVFAPTALRVFQAPLQSASVIDPASGANKFGSWMHSTQLAAQIVGAAAAVSTSGS